MKAWIKRTIVGVVSAIIVVIGSVLVFLYFVLPDLCGNEVVVRLNSPDKKYKALLFQRDCGATTGFSTQISVLGINESLNNEGGNVFAASNHPNRNKFVMNWKDSRTLIIKNSKLAQKTFRKQNNVGAVSIQYE